MTKFYVDPNPVGVTPPSDHDRQPIQKLVGGDSLAFETIVQLDDGTAATESNSKLTFVLSNQRFAKDPIWTGDWYVGIVPVGGATPGRVRIQVPDSITAALLRGSYIYSLLLTDRLNNNRRTIMTGTLLVEYEPTSPQHEIPYKSEA